MHCKVFKSILTIFIFTFLFISKLLAVQISDNARNIYIVYGDTSQHNVVDKQLLSVPDESYLRNWNQDIVKQFHKLQEKGYRLTIIKDIENSELAKIVSDPNTVAIFHHGHGAEIEKNGLVTHGISSFESKKQSAILPEFMEKYTNGNFKPGENLRYYFFTGCYGNKCEDNFRNAFHVTNENIKYFGNEGLIDSKQIADEIRTGQNFKEILTELPDKTPYLNQLLASAPSNRNSFLQLLDWYPDTNETNRIKIRDAIDKGISAKLFSVQDILSTKDNSKISSFIRAMNNEKSSHILTSTDKDLLLNLVAHEDYFVRHYATKFALERNLQVPPTAQHTLINNLFANRPSHIPYNYQYNGDTGMLDKLTQHLLSKQNNFTDDTYREILEHMKSNDALANYLYQFPNDQERLKKIILDEFKSNTTNRNPTLLKIYKDHFGVDNDLNNVLNNYSHANLDIKKIEANIHLFENGNLPNHADFLKELMREYPKAKDGQLKATIVTAIGYLGKNNPEVANFLRINYPFEDDQIKWAFVKAIGRTDIRDPIFIDLLLDTLEKDRISSYDLVDILPKFDLSAPHYQNRLKNMNRYFKRHCDRRELFVNQLIAANSRQSSWCLKNLLSRLLP